MNHTHEPKSFRGIIAAIVKVVLFCAVWTGTLLLIWTRAKFELPYSKEYSLVPTVLSGGDFFAVALILLIVIAAPLFEELVFRALPLYLAARISKNNQKAIWGTAVALSVLFGLAHLVNPVFNLLCQGVAGLLFSYLYLKCGGWRGAFWKPLLSTAVAHGVWNGAIVALMYFA